LGKSSVFESSAQLTDNEKHHKEQKNCLAAPFICLFFEKYANKNSTSLYVFKN